MKAISEFIISVFNMAEAEGRDLRASIRGEASAFRAAVVSLALALAVLILAVLCLAGGAWLVVFGFHLWLESQVPRPLAAALAGLSVVIIGVGGLVLCRSMTSARTGRGRE